jgi:creatinine amidohydrolase
MKIADMNWMQVEEYLRHDDRCVLPVGSTEQHAYLSLCVDNILAERVSVEAAEPLGIPVFPPLNYGITPYFRAYPGSVTLRVETYLRIIRDVLDSLGESGFKRILVVNGHGGNTPAQTLAIEWMADNPGRRVTWHNWWNAPRIWAKVMEIDPVASHASWMENFPWVRLPSALMPAVQKPMIDSAHMRLLNPQETRAYLGDGNYGGYYQRPDAEMLAIWDVAVQETRDLLAGDWGI